jgi:hypothetical protein
MGWLEKFANWLKDIFLAIWNAVADAVHDAGVWLFEQMCDIASTVINAIPVPDFLADLSFSALFANIDSPLLNWMMGTFQLPACFLILGAGVAFNLLRKLLTLGQW